MAIDSYMAFKVAGGNWLAAESQVTWKDTGEELASKPSKPPSGSLFEIESYDFDVEQTLNIGSQSSGAGAGKITFNPFSITRPIDKASTTFYKMACNGTAFEHVMLLLRKSVGSGGGGDATSGGIFLRFDFKLVAVKTIKWSHDDTSPKEEISFEYGGLQMRYSQQDPTGKLMGANIAGWNRVYNVYEEDLTPIGKK